MFSDRRQFLTDFGSGLGGVALAWLLGNRPLNGAEKFPNFQPKAKRIIQIFCPGAASHIDLWDHKPELERMHGKPLPGEENVVTFQGKNGNLMRSPWDFQPQGETGKMITSMLPNLGQLADKMAFIHSMQSRSNTHGPACVAMNTGFIFEGFPSAGSWVSYALGAENQNLPAFVAIPDVRGIPPSGPANWTSGFLPAQHQAIAFSSSDPIRDLKRPDSVSPDAERATRDFLSLLNREHQQKHAGNSDLAGRVAAYELALTAWRYGSI